MVNNYNSLFPNWENIFLQPGKLAEAYSYGVQNKQVS